MSHFITNLEQKMLPDERKRAVQYLEIEEVIKPKNILAVGRVVLLQ